MAASSAGSITSSKVTRAKTRPIPPRAAKLADGHGVVQVTADRTNGVGCPTVSESAFAPPGLLVAEAVATAVGSLETLDRDIHEVADAFRGDRVAEGRQGLAELILTTQTLLKLAAMTAEATGANLDQLCGRDGSRTDEDTRAAVERIIEQQLAGDWAALADTLDQYFTPALAQWRPVFVALGQIMPSSDLSGRTA